MHKGHTYASTREIHELTSIWMQEEGVRLTRKTDGMLKLDCGLHAVPHRDLITNTLPKPLMFNAWMAWCN